MAKKDSFKEPTGLQIEYRNVKKYVFKWNTAQSYDSQLLEWGYNGNKKSGDGVKLKGKDKDYTLNLKFNPKPDGSTKVGSVYFRVKGVKGKKSGWSNKKTFDIKTPANLKGSRVGYVDSGEADVIKFDLHSSPGKSTPVVDIKWQSRFFKDFTKTSEKDLKGRWSKGTESHSGQINSASGTAKVTHAHMDRYGMICLRAQARNSQGNSDWRYYYFPWSKTNQSKNVDTNMSKVEEDESLQVIKGKLEWSFSANSLKEIDHIELKYRIGVPTAGLGLPNDGSNWTPYATPNGMKKARNGSIDYVIEGTLGDDQCLWWRVDAYSPSYPSVPPAIGAPKLALKGNLATPTLSNLELVPETHIIRVTATNNSQVEDSVIAIVYHDSSGTSEIEDKVIGFIEHDKTSVELEVPDWGENDVSIEIFAVAGAKFIINDTPNGYTYYDLCRYEKTVKANYVYDQVLERNYCYITVPDIANFDDNDLRANKNVVFSSKYDPESPYKPGEIVYSKRIGDPEPGRDKKYLAWANPDFTIYTHNVKPSGMQGTVINKNQVLLMRNENHLQGSVYVFSEGYVSYVQDQKERSYMVSDRNSDSESSTASVPKAPDGLAAVQIGNDPIIQVTWNMNWEEANGTEISWADHEDAWYSTSGPNTYEVDNIREPKLNLADVALGTTWYIRARFYKNTSDGNKIYGPYADVNEGNGYSTASSPNVPWLELSDDNIPDTGYVTASWAYVSNDGTEQDSAVLGEIVEGEENPQEFNNISILTAQHVTLYAEDMGWQNDTTHNLVIKVHSESGEWSEWSDPVPLTIAPKLDCQITETSLQYVNTVENPQTYSGASVSFNGGTEDDRKELYNFVINIDPIEEDSKYVAQTTTVLTLNGATYNIDWSTYTNAFYGGTVDIVTGELTNKYTRSKESVTEVTNIEPMLLVVEAGTNTASASTGNVSVTTADSFKRGYFLKSMPLTATATGVGGEGKLYFIINRDGDYQMLRPNDVTTLGPDGETAFRDYRFGDGQMTINTTDLVNYLDDGASYKLRVIAYDESGQTDEKSIPFTVEWAHQAIMPEGAAIVQNGIGIISPFAVQGSETGDYIDIYRLTADKPQLIFTGAQFGEVYVDPYPTIGQEGGYRLVYITNNGDYITADTMLAWLDIPTNFNTKFQLIDFDNTEIEFKYNVNLDNSWKKKFTQTNYLGGSTIGDWDSGTTFETSVSGNTFYDIEPEVYEQLRDLADYGGMCHLRTIDGTNICCNIEVSDRSTFNSLEHQHDISLSIQKVDNPNLDGMTLEEWQYINEGE